jgi:hypothetical protein
MKKTFIYLAIIAFNSLISCNEGNNKSHQKLHSDLLVKKQCFIALFRQDTALLRIDSFKSGKITGNLVMKYSKSPKYDGTLKGKFNGDTLFADYTFITDSVKTAFNRNPLAFLKKENELVLGVGVIMVYPGGSFLSKSKPINFEKGRFRFKPVNCTNQ